MKRTAIDRRTQKLAWASGLPWKVAKARVQALAAHQPLIAEASRDQAVLECHFLHALARPRCTTLHPWGIRSVAASTSRLVVTFETVQSNRGEGDDETTVLGLMRAVLPLGGDSGDVYGIAGARLRVEDGTVVLRRFGLNAAIQLDGFAPHAVQAAAMRVADEARQDGMAPCQQESPERWHACEREYMRRGTTDWYETLMATSAWLPSGLLRRAPLLRAVGIPLSTTAWTDADPYGPGELWKVDQEHFEPQAGSGVSHHRPFIAMLTDPECGMPLALEHEACRCATGRCDDCRVYLRSHGRPGRLEMRFTRRADFYLERAQSTVFEFERRRRLYRRLPATFR
ncbi:hypothetical protein [Streptomyces venezuelae]|uniref:hypothetical protein n=1 Tax=Streptomyces venezuelae TaxID=54571 RepID=UPI00342D482C